MMSTFRNLFRRNRVEHELDQELHSYLDLLIEEKIKAGSSPADARRAARIELGGIDQVKEEVRDVRSGILFQTMMQDLRYAVRVLAKNPGFTTTAVLALAVGIGANSTIFSIVDSVLLRPLPYPAADRLMTVSMHFAPQNAPLGTMCMADFLDWKSRNRSFENPTAFSMNLFDLTGTGEPEQIRGTAVTSGFFPTLRAQPIIGRVFESQDDNPSSDRTAVLAESFWRNRFAGSPTAIGQAIALNGHKYTVIGVMPSSFQFGRPDVALWTNLRLTPPARRGPFNLRGIARLKDGVTRQQAQAETNALGQQIERASPSSYSRLTLPVTPLRDVLAGNTRPALLVLSGAVLLVLLIATVNVANLILARAAAREREMALRLSLGAGRGRLIRQLLTESILLALLGGTGGIALAYAAITAIRLWNPGGLPRMQDVHLDLRVVAFTFVISLCTGILAGLVPALQGSRTDLNSTLKSGNRGSSVNSSRRTHSILVIAEIALSCMLLIGAGLLLRSFFQLQQVDAGFQTSPETILTLAVSPSQSNYPDDRSGIAFYQRLLNRISQIPGLDSIAISDSLPPNRESDSDTFQIQGHSPETGTYPSTTVGIVSSRYFESLGIRLIRGRFFNDRDTPDSPYVTIISESMARRYFAGQNPIGQHLKQSGVDVAAQLPWMEIVGVVGDVKYLGLETDSGAAYYRPFTQDYGRRMYLVVRSSTAARLAPALRREIHEVDKDVVISDVNTLARMLSESVEEPRFRTLLIGLFAAIALCLAAIGIYGVIAYAVTQRTHEIGIRMALGAKRDDVLRLILGQSAILSAAGILLGLAGALAITRLLSGLLFGISATDPLTFIAVAMTLVAVALIAALIPARRAIRIDPLTALKYE